MFLELKSVSKSFRGVVALRNLDLEVNEGEILGLIGPNGSGKTTLFNVVTGLLKLDSGELYFRGNYLNKLKPHQICKLGIVKTFQLARPFPYMTCLQNVMVGRIYGREPLKSMKQARAEAEEILDLAGLADKGDVIAASLTLLDRKRLELGRALAAKPELLLLDEMMAGLSIAETNDAMRLVQDLRASGITVVMVEHIVKAVLGISERVVVLNAGEKIAEGTPVEIANNQQVIEAYLGTGSYA